MRPFSAPELPRSLPRRTPLGSNAPYEIRQVALDRIGVALSEGLSALIGPPGTPAGPRSLKEIGPRGRATRRVLGEDDLEAGAATEIGRVSWNPIAIPEFPS
ncbi:hypothetical protein GCM10022294_28560 [Dietzia aurantiaca]